MSIQDPPDKVASPITLWAAAPFHRFSVEEFHRMAEAGAFKPDSRVELLDGWLFDMNPIGISHRLVVQRAFRVLSQVLPAGWDLLMQQPIVLPTSEPQPDLTVIRGNSDDYKDRHPGPGDVGLIIEVADSSLAVDRREKFSIYAAAGISHYWIINLVDREVEICAAPMPQQGAEPASYRQRAVVETDGSLPLILDGRQVCTTEVAELFPYIMRSRARSSGADSVHGKIVPCEK
jgi:Uma2 family endonuclease